MLISIQMEDSRPIYLQIVAQVKQQISTGALPPGAALPSVRELAGSLGVNMHTVHRAYQRLRDEGVIHLRLGQGARVAPLRQGPARPDEVEALLAGRLRELMTEAFHLGLRRTELRQLVEELLKEVEETDARVEASLVDERAGAGAAGGRGRGAAGGLSPAGAGAGPL